MPSEQGREQVSCPTVCHNCGARSICPCGPDDPTCLHCVPRVCSARVEQGVGSTSYGFRCSCGEFSGYGMRERHARAAMLKHIGHVLTITPVREPGFGGKGGWAYLPSCSCGQDRGDPVDHRMSASIWHEDHLHEVNAPARSVE